MTLKPISHLNKQPIKDLYHALNDLMVIESQLSILDLDEIEKTAKKIRGVINECRKEKTPPFSTKV